MTCLLGTSVQEDLDKIDAAAVIFDAIANDLGTVSTRSGAVKTIPQMIADYANGLGGVADDLGVLAFGATTRRALKYHHGDTVSVKDFGAVGDGVTDDTAAIQAALTAKGATGGIIFFPPGDYRHSGLTMTNAAGVRLVALGLWGNATQDLTGKGVKLRCSSSTAVHLTLTDCNRISIEGLTFAPVTGVTPTAGNGLYVLRGNRLELSKVRFHNTFDSIRVVEHKELTADDVEVAYVRGNYGISVVGSSGAKSIVHRWSNVTIYSQIDGGDTLLDGIRLGAYCYTHHWKNVVVNDCRRGVVIGEGATTADRPLFLWFDETDTEQCVDGGIVIGGGSFMWFRNGYQSYNERGFWFLPTCTYAANQSGPFFLIDNLVNTNGLEGVLLEGCPQVTIRGGQVANNSNPDITLNGSKGPTNTYPGISLTASVGVLEVSGVRCGGGALGHPGTTGHQNYGLLVGAGVTTPRLRIVGNDFSGNATAGVSDLSTQSDDKVTIANLGAEDSMLGLRKSGTGVTRWQAECATNGPILELVGPTDDVSGFIKPKGNGLTYIQRKGTNLREMGLTVGGAAPTVNDDITLGYVQGDQWIYNSQHYVCVNNADGAAVWKQTTV